MKKYGLDYIAGSEAKKLDYDYDYDFENQSDLKVKKVKKASSTSNEMSLASKIKWTASVVVVFSMFMLLTFRSNLISEKNLKAINLKSELENVSSNLSLAMMNVEQGANLSEIEAYAKQKLGMQKPEKNQIVYIDSSNLKNVENNVVEDTSSFFDKVKEFLGIK